MNFIKNQQNKLGMSAISFSCVIIQDRNSKAYYGTVKEVEGVIVKGDSEQEVMEKIPKAIKAINDAKRKYSDATKNVLKDNTYIVKEYQQDFVAC